MKPIRVAGQPLAQGRLPAICAPLVGRTVQALTAEAATVAALAPDLLEWRVDFFDRIADPAAVLDAAASIRQAAGGIPLLFTRRSQREGGQPLALPEPAVVDLYEEVCASGDVALVDFEMGNEPAHVARVRDAARRCGVQLVLSFHDFDGTPALADLVGRYQRAEQLGADVAKVAVMPRRLDDVLVLLQATLQASGERAIPVVGMSMAGPGALTRVCGGVFGSALTFAVGQGSSAPGQMPIADVRAGIELLRRAMGGGAT